MRKTEKDKKEITRKFQVEEKIKLWSRYLTESLFQSAGPCYIEEWIVNQEQVFANC